MVFVSLCSCNLQIIKDKVVRIKKGDECRSSLQPRPDYKDELYCRAIYLGQGCWERLRSIDEAEALEILREWGYTENPPSEK